VPLPELRPTGRLKDALTTVQRQHPTAYDPLVEHLLGGTSADWLAETLTEHGAPVGATTIKAYRRRIAERSV
jgi:hypothetical protein